MKALTARSASRSLKALANPQTAAVLQRFFKTGPGEYGEGDQFYGVKVPQTRSIARQYAALPLRECITLLHSTIHEERLLALIILVHQYKKGTPRERHAIFSVYLRNVRKINNWDLVDLSAYFIVGPHVEANPSPLFKLARSKHLWSRRISIIATFHFIRLGRFDVTLKIAEILLNDEEDLIHKATGWMIREVGKRDLNVAEKFLRKYAGRMPRTMLRYAIEKFPAKKRAAYLKGVGS